MPDGRSAAHEATADLLQKLSEIPKLGLYYEAVLRQVDMLLPMLTVLRSRLPGVPAVMGTALNLPPFADDTIGAIHLWNALQAFPDDAGRPESHLVFEREQLRQRLSDAGLTVREESSDIGTFVFVTAERVA